MTVREMSIASTNPTTRNAYQRGSTAMCTQPASRATASAATPTTDEREHRRLEQSRQVLRLPVPVLVRLVGRPAGDAEREEREQRRDEIRPRVQRLRDQAERAARDAGRELERDQGAGRPDRDERRPTLRVHDAL